MPRWRNWWTHSVSGTSAKAWGSSPFLGTSDLNEGLVKAGLFFILHRLNPVLYFALTGTSAPIVSQAGEAAGETFAHILAAICGQRSGRAARYPEYALLTGPMNKISPSPLPHCSRAPSLGRPRRPRAPPRSSRILAAAGQSLNGTITTTGVHGTGSARRQCWQSPAPPLAPGATITKQPAGSGLCATGTQPPPAQPANTWYYLQARPGNTYLLHQRLP